jgi:dUTP pyrophosphatase
MLNAKEIRQLIETCELISDYVNLDKQLQPAGFDLSLSQVHAYRDGGSVDFSNDERVIASTEPVELDEDGWYFLPQGCYQIVYNEVVSMPLDIVAIARSRSTVLRNGATVETAVWDPGYRGRSSSLLVVHNPYGIRLKKDARVTQLIFYRIQKTRDSYTGIYQDERTRTED